MSKLPKSNSSIFDKYAYEYDLITNAVQREKMHTKEVAAIVERFEPETVLDAGCASGLTSALFARQGITTVGLDRSKKMLEVAKSKYLGCPAIHGGFHNTHGPIINDGAPVRKVTGSKLKEKKLPLDFLYGNFEKLPKKLYGKFDLVVCLANSISGVGSVASLRESLGSFWRVLRPGGHLVMQLLNIGAMSESRLTPVRVTANNGIVYSRFTERRGKRLNLFVTRVDLNKEPPDYEIFRHEYDCFDLEQVSRSLKACRFISISKFADLYFKKRFGKSSRDLVITAQKLSN